MAKLLAIACAIGLLAATPVLAGEIRGSAFKSGNWEGGAYDADGGFSHCAISVAYKSGIRLHFAIDKDYLWRMGMSHADWTMQPGENLAIRYQVDKHQAVSATAKVISSDFLLAELIAKDYLFNQFRRGRLLKVEAGGQLYTFALHGTSRALARTLKCVGRYLDYTAPVARAPAPAPAAKAPAPAPVAKTPPLPAPVVAAPAQTETPADAAPRMPGSGVPKTPAAPPAKAAAASPPAKPAAPPRTPAAASGPAYAESPKDILDATRFVIALFSSNEFADHKLTDQSDLGAEAPEFLRRAAVGWTSPDTRGALHVFEAGASTDAVLADMIATDSRKCSGSFASGKKPARDDPAVLTAFTACKAGEMYEFYADYLAFEAASGQLYLMSSLQTAAPAINRDVSDRLARNVALVRR